MTPSQPDPQRPEEEGEDAQPESSRPRMQFVRTQRSDGQGRQADDNNGGQPSGDGEGAAGRASAPPAGRPPQDELPRNTDRAANPNRPAKDRPAGQANRRGPDPAQPNARPNDAAGNATSADADANLPAVAKGRDLEKREAPKPPAKKKQTPPQKSPKQPKAKSPPPVKPMAGNAQLRTRHGLILFSFIGMVVLPLVLAGFYLWTRAADQYASSVGFSVRTEEAGASIELLGAISGLSGSSSSDTDILYEFLQSQELVRRLDDQLDLRAIWSRADPQVDPIFAFHPPGSIEDLLDYWPRMVRIHYDSGSGLIDLRVLAFAPDDARAVAQQIFEESSEMINQLSAIAREDAIRYARDELAAAEERLTEARVALTAFRNRTQIVDPTIDTQSQMGLVTNLQAQLAEALIELDILRETTRDNDPRVTQAERRIAVIEDRIAAERANIGAIGGDGGAFADLVGEYERLVVDQEFAEQAYTAALAAFDAARNEARRQSRYLAAHVTPTLAESAQYPQRGTLTALIGVFAFLLWSVVVLVSYSLRDRR